MAALLNQANDLIGITACPSVDKDRARDYRNFGLSHCDRESQVLFVGCD
jgi:hypothetical protein